MITCSSWYAEYECMIGGNLVVADTLRVGVDGAMRLTLGDDVVAMAPSTATFVRLRRVENPDADEITGRSSQN